MPVRLADIARERRELVIPTSDGDLTVVYRPNVRTPADEARLANSKGEDVYREMLAQMCNLVAEWDLFGSLFDEEDGTVLVADGEMVPLKPEVLQFLPTQLLSNIFQAILEDLRPKAKNEETSSKTSRGLFSKGSFN